MQLRALVEDEGGVSPVIGVILMVAITVILAAVIAAFVLGIGDTEDPAPSANIEIDTEDRSPGVPFVLLEHRSGDAFAAEDVQLSIDGPSNSATDALSDAKSPGGTEFDGILFPAQAVVPSTVAAGDTIELNVFGIGGTDDVKVQLVWAPDGDAESTFFTETVDVP